jgi:hypothetical protein
MMSDRPIVWHNSYNGGRGWHTAGEHTRESYSEPAMPSRCLEYRSEARQNRPPGLEQSEATTRLIDLEVQHTLHPGRVLAQRAASRVMMVGKPPGEMHTALLAVGGTHAAVPGG